MWGLKKIGFFYYSFLFFFFLFYAPHVVDYLWFWILPWVQKKEKNTKSA